MRRSFPIGLALVALGAGGAAQAQGAGRAAPVAGGALEISGTSTVRPWSCREASIGATGANGPAAAGGVNEAAPPARSSSPTPGAVANRLVLTFPVGGIDCGDPKINGQLRQALKANRYPAITFGLPAPEVTRALAAGAGTVVVNGELTIAGKTKPVQTEVTLTRAAGQDVQVQGEQSLRMTDFGLKPPVLMLGLLKVRDLVHVAFDVVLRAATLHRLSPAVR